MCILLQIRYSSAVKVFEKPLYNAIYSNIYPTMDLFFLTSQGVISRNRSGLRVGVFRDVSRAFANV